MKLFIKSFCLISLCVILASCQPIKDNTIQELHFNIQYPESVKILALDKDTAYICYAGETEETLEGRERDKYTLHKKNIQYGTYNLKSKTLTNDTEKFQQNMNVADYHNGSCLLQDGKLYIVGMDTQPVNLSLNPTPQPEIGTYIYDFNQKTLKKGYNYGSRGMITSQLEWLSQNEFLIWMKNWDGYSTQGVYRYNCIEDTMKPVIEFETEDYVNAASYHNNMIWVYITKPINTVQKEHYLLGYDLEGNQKEKIILPSEISEYKSRYYQDYCPGYLVALDNGCFYIQHDSSQGSFIVQAEGDTSKIIASLIYDELESVIYSKCNSFYNTEKDLFLLDYGRKAIIRFEPDTLDLKELPWKRLENIGDNTLLSLSVGEDNSLILKIKPSNTSAAKEAEPEGNYYYISPQAFEKEAVDISYLISSSVE